jgi:hypothetical protein
MTDTVQRSLGRLEGEVKGVREDIQELRGDIKGLTKKTYAHSGIFSIIVAFITAKLTGSH